MSGIIINTYIEFGTSPPPAGGDFFTNDGLTDKLFTDDAKTNALKWED